jgi:hypothetical protein
MIDKSEIDAKAEELGVHAANVQRDYVFGWLLSRSVSEIYGLKRLRPTNDHDGSDLQLCS